MPALLKVEFTDVNGLKADSSVWIDDEANFQDVLDAFKSASNAKLTHATLSVPVDITGLAGNDAIAANVETVAQKAEIQYRAPAPDGGAAPFVFVNIGIPAPIGTLINGPGGSLTNADVVSLMDRVSSEDGTRMTVVQRIRYRR